MLLTTSETRATTRRARLCQACRHICPGATAPCSVCAHPEQDARRLRDELLPAFDRAANTFISAIRTLREFHSIGVNITIGQAAQVNVAEQRLVVGPIVPPPA